MTYPNPETDARSGLSEPAESRPKWPQPGELWSLWDLMKLVDASEIADVGDRVRLARVVISEADGGKLRTSDQAIVDEAVEKIVRLCGLLDEPTVAEIVRFSGTLDELDEIWTVSRWEVIESAFWNVAVGRQFHYIEKPRQKFLDAEGELIPHKVRRAFPGATSELLQAGRAFCFDLYDAAVFHCMRAVEIGARSLATDLGCTFPQPIDQVDLHPLLEQCEAKISAMKRLPRSASKAADLEFYSTAASNFRYFKDGWRIRATHGRASFQQVEAERLLTRTVEFFEAISVRLKE